MSVPFDGFYTWLGIPPAEQPPHHYRLLGLQTFEANADVIENAADRQMRHVRSFQVGAHAADSQKILNQISAARGTLLDPAKKSQYDRELQARLPQNKPIPAARPLPLPTRPVPVMQPLPVPMQPPAGPPHYSPQPNYAQPNYAQPNYSPQSHSPPSYAPPQPVAPGYSAPGYSPEPAAGFSAPAGNNLHFSTRRKKQQGGGGVLGLVKVLVGGAGGLAIALLILWVAFRSDPFSLFTSQPDSLAKNAAPVANPPGQVAADPAATTTVASTTPKPGDTAQTGAGQSSAPGSEGTPNNPGTPKNPSTPAKSGTTPATPQPAGTNNPASGPASGSGAAGTPAVGSNPAGTSPPGQTDVIQIEVTPEVASAPQQPIPSAEVQKAKLAELKQLYRADFESGAKPANRIAFIEFLTKTAHTLASDPAAQFVLLREAYDKALLQKDFLLAAEIVDELERGFEFDPLKLRLAVLTQASAAAKAPTERTTAMTCASELAEYALQSNQLAEALKLAKIAEGQARSLGDNAVKAKMLATVAEIEKRAAELGPLDRARQTLATNPADPEANLVVGKHRCLVLGDWREGIAALARSSDVVLAKAADRDIAGASADVTAGELGEMWFELAKSHASLQGFYRRAEHWYRLATSDAQNLEQAKVQQRLEQIAAMNLPVAAAAASGNQGQKLKPFAAMMSGGQQLLPVNLFTKIPIPQPRGNTGWSPRGTSAIDSDSAVPYARVQTTFTPPREYQLSLRVRRNSGAPDRMGPLVIGLVSGKSQFLAVIDAAGNGQYASLLTEASARTLAENSTVQQATVPLLKASAFAGGQLGGAFQPGVGMPASDQFVVCQVRRRGVTVLVDGQLACQFSGDLGQLSVPREWSIGDSKVLFLGSHLGDFRVDAWSVDPLPAAGGAFGAPGIDP